MRVGVLVWRKAREAFEHATKALPAGTRRVSVLVAATLVVGGLHAQAQSSRPASAATPALRAVTVDELLRLARQPGAKAVVVNVWATWCVPCRQELPDLLRVGREYRNRGLRLVLVSADFEDDGEQARAFLSRLGVDFPTFLKKGPDAEFIDRLSPKWSGALPATFIYDDAGGLREFWEGMATYETFAAKVRAVIEARATGGARG